MSETKIFELQIEFIAEHSIKITDCKKQISRNATKISSLRQSHEVLGKKYCEFQIDKCKEKGIVLESQLKTLEFELESLKFVSSDFFISKLDAIKEQTKDFYDTQAMKLEKKKKKQKGAVEFKESKKSEEKKIDEKTGEVIKVEKPKKKKFKHKHVEEEFKRDYGLEKYWESSDSLPSWAKDSLEKIPHNFGFIWKHTWFFGALDPIPNKPQIMFEIKKNGKFMVHEYWKNNCAEVNMRMCKHPNQYIEKYINPSNNHDHHHHHRLNDHHQSNDKHRKSNQSSDHQRSNDKHRKSNQPSDHQRSNDKHRKSTQLSGHQRKPNHKKQQVRAEKEEKNVKPKKKKTQVSSDGWTTVL